MNSSESIRVSFLAPQEYKCCNNFYCYSYFHQRKLETKYVCYEKQYPDYEGDVDADVCNPASCFFIHDFVPCSFQYPCSFSEMSCIASKNPALSTSITFDSISASLTFFSFSNMVSTHEKTSSLYLYGFETKKAFIVDDTSLAPLVSFRCATIQPLSPSANEHMHLLHRIVPSSTIEP